MPRRIVFELDLSGDEEVTLMDEQNMALQAKEAFVMKLLRGHEISQGKAAALLGISRLQLFDLMSLYRVPVIDMTEEEMKEEFNTSTSVDQRKRALAVAGRFRSGLGDLSRQHDAYAAEAFAR